MKPLEHTSALGWIIALSAFGWLASGLVVVLSLSDRGSTLPLAIGSAGFFLTILIPSIVGAVVLHGVKQMLRQVREPEMLPERPARKAPAEPDPAPVVADEPSVLPPQEGWSSR